MKNNLLLLFCAFLIGYSMFYLGDWVGRVNEREQSEIKELVLRQRVEVAQLEKDQWFEAYKNDCKPLSIEQIREALGL
jgi:hypothetical protein